MVMCRRSGGPAMDKVSRRELGRLAAGLAAAHALPLRAQEPAPASPYIGPLTGMEERVADRQFDPVIYTRELFAAAPRRLRFESRSRADAEGWQRTLRAKVIDLLGGFPTERSPLRATTIETRSFPAYRREKIVFDSRPGTSVLAYVMLPARAALPPPTMICVPGHGRGVDDIVGIDEHGRDRTDKAGDQHDFAIQVAEAGMAAVAIEPMGFGCRRDPLNARQGLGRKACEPVAGGALRVGETTV